MTDPILAARALNRAAESLHHTATEAERLKRENPVENSRSELAVAALVLAALAKAAIAAADQLMRDGQ